MTLVVANVVMGVLAPLLWDALKPYQQRRLLVFLDPMNDPRASGYHVIQSQVAIGSGGWFGKGWTLGTQKRLAFLPAQHTDFIFAVVGEETGLHRRDGRAGAVPRAAAALHAHRVTRDGRASAAWPRSDSSSSWFVHVVVNIGMTLNLMPITGIPLPFFSYGGSFMLISWLAVGLLVRISAEGRGRSDYLAV